MFMEQVEDKVEEGQEEKPSLSSSSEPSSPVQLPVSLVVPPTSSSIQPESVPQLQLQDFHLPRLTVPQLQERIQRERTMLFAAVLARHRLVKPQFANFPLREQRRLIWYRIELLFASWEQDLLNTLLTPSMVAIGW